MELLISGYGGEKTHSIGLYDIELTKKRDDELIWGSYLLASSFLSHYGELLFGITEEEGRSEIHMFRRLGNGYHLMDSKKLNCGLLCHIQFLSQSKTLVGSSYQDGEVFSIAVGENGFGVMMDYILQEGNKDKISRAHCAVSNCEEDQLFVANIATDRIYRYSLQNGRLIDKDFIQLNEGEGPRHILLTPNQRNIYIITEYSNNIICIEVSNDNLIFKSSVSTLPMDFEGISYGSSICMSLDKKFLYAANRGANTIAVFKIVEDVTLEKIDDIDCHGDWPRHIALISNDDYLAIANQRSNEVVLVKRNKETGLLGKIIKKIAFDQPSFVSEL